MAKRKKQQNTDKVAQLWIVKKEHFDKAYVNNVNGKKKVSIGLCPKCHPEAGIAVSGMRQFVELCCFNCRKSMFCFHVKSENAVKFVECEFHGGASKKLEYDGKKAKLLCSKCNVVLNILDVVE